MRFLITTVDEGQYPLHGWLIVMLKFASVNIWRQTNKIISRGGKNCDGAGVAFSMGSVSLFLTP